MLNKALVSPLALAAGLMFAGAAFAQTSVGDQQVTDADLPAVQAHCDALAQAASTAATGEELSVEADANVTTGVELSTITLQHCIDAGLIEGPVPGTTPEVNSGDEAADDADTEGTTDSSN